MPPTTDNPAGYARDEGRDDEWARWEQTFRDARPVLPEAAMARIEGAMRRETDRIAARPPTPMRGRIGLLLLALIAVNVIAFWLISRRSGERPAVPGPDTAVPAARVQDHYPLEIIIGPPLVKPSRPIIALAENWKWISSERPEDPPIAPAPARPTPDQLVGAERLFQASPDGWHALGLLEMNRSRPAGGASPAAFAGVRRPDPMRARLGEFRFGSMWRMLEGNHLGEFCNADLPSDAALPDAFWRDVFVLLRAWHLGDPAAIADVKLAEAPSAFPSRTGDLAQFDLLGELGMLPAQAGLDVLMSRSYEPLRKLKELDRWDAVAPLRDRLNNGYFAGSHDLIERLFALQLLGRAREAQELIEKTKALHYLVDPDALMVLLARLGPVNAWEKLVHPLMQDEVGFIEHPPNFGESETRSPTQASIEAAVKSEQGGETVYSGNVILSAGAWRMSCEKLVVSRESGHVVFRLSGAFRISRIYGLLPSTADDAAFDADTGELKLSGHVRLDQWTAPRTVHSCTIAPTGKVRDVRE